MSGRIEVVKPVSYGLVSRQQRLEAVSFVVVCCWILLGYIGLESPPWCFGC